MKPLNIAVACHTILSSLTVAFGGEHYLSWDDSSQEFRDASIHYVEKLLAEPEATPEKLHAAWSESMLASGWEFGEDYNLEAKLHPNLVEYSELSDLQKAKDHALAALVNHLRDIPDPSTFLELSGEVITLRKQVMSLREQLEQRQHQEVKEIQEKTGIAIQYIGMKSMWSDRIYGTGLTFTPTQRRVVPVAIAEKLLKHPEFRKVVKNNVAPGELQAVDVDVKLQSEKVDEEKTKDEQEQNKIYDEIETISRMNTKAVLKYVRENYDQKLDEGLGLKALREEAVSLIHRFGVVG